MESAAPESAGIREEGGGGDACHGATSRAPLVSAQPAPGGRREGGRQGGVRRGGAGGGGERRGEGSAEDRTEGEGARAMEGLRGETGRQRGGGGGGGGVGSGGGRGGGRVGVGVRPPQLGGGTRARGNSCAAPTSAPGPRPHLGAPATNFISLGLPFTVGNTCNLFGASLVMCITFLVYIHLLITLTSLQ